MLNDHSSYHSPRDIPNDIPRGAPEDRRRRPRPTPRSWRNCSTPPSPCSTTASSASRSGMGTSPGARWSARPSWTTRPWSPGPNTTGRLPLPAPVGSGPTNGGISALTAGCGFSGAWSRWTRRSRPAAVRGSGIGSDAEKTADADPGGVSTADAVRGMPNADSDEMAVSGQLSLPRLFSQPSTPGPRIRPVLNGEIRFPNGFEISDSPFLTAPGAGVWRQA